MENPLNRLEEARKQLVIATGAIEDDEQLEALQEARRLIDDVVDADADADADGGTQPDRERV